MDWVSVVLAALMAFLKWMANKSEIDARTLIPQALERAKKDSTKLREKISSLRNHGNDAAATSMFNRAVSQTLALAARLSPSKKRSGDTNQGR